MAWTILFYEKPNGKKPIEEFLATLNDKTRAKLISYIGKFQEHGFNLPTGFVEKIEDNLWTLRPDYGGNAYRIFFCRTGAKETAAILHIIAKKKRRLPSNEIETAKSRRNEISKQIQN